MSNVFNQIGFLPKGFNVTSAGSDADVIQDFTINGASTIGSIGDGIYPCTPVEFSFYKVVTVTTGVLNYNTLFTYNFKYDSTVNKYPPYTTAQVYFTAYALTGVAIGSQGRVGLYGMRSVLGYGSDPTVSNTVFNTSLTRTYTWTYITAAASTQNTFILFNHLSTNTSIGLVPSINSGIIDYNFRVRMSGGQGTAGTWAIQGLATLF